MLTSQAGMHAGLTAIICLLFALIGYMFGNVSNAQIFADIKKINIQQTGSGNLGATNSYRSLGAGSGLLVFLLDMIKGYLAVVVCYVIAMGTIFQWYDTSWPIRSVIFIGGVFAVIGHVWSIKYIMALCKNKFHASKCHEFIGGKGVSTFTGVLFALSPYIALLCMFVWFVVYFICRYVCVASSAFVGISSFLIFIPQVNLAYLTQAFEKAHDKFYPVTYSGDGVWYIIITFIIFLLLSTLIILRHIENFKRMSKHQEHKFYFIKKRQEKYEAKRKEKYGDRSLVVVDEKHNKKEASKVNEPKHEESTLKTERVKKQPTKKVDTNKQDDYLSIRSSSLLNQPKEPTKKVETHNDSSSNPSSSSVERALKVPTKKVEDSSEK